LETSLLFFETIVLLFILEIRFTTSGQGINFFFTLLLWHQKLKVENRKIETDKIFQFVTFLFVRSLKFGFFTSIHGRISQRDWVMTNKEDY
jgi:hypothetical protein